MLIVGICLSGSQADVSNDIAVAVAYLFSAEDISVLNSFMYYPPEDKRFICRSWGSGCFSKGLWVLLVVWFDFAVQPTYNPYTPVT